MKFESSLSEVVKINITVSLMLKLCFYTSLFISVMARCSFLETAALFVFIVMMAGITSIIAIPSIRLSADVYMKGQKVHFLRDEKYWYISYPRRTTKCPIWSADFKKLGDGGELRIKFPMSLFFCYVNFRLHGAEKGVIK